MESIFDKDFYPTPEHVFTMMEVDASNKTILEPQAGDGQLVGYLLKAGAKKVMCCEVNTKLRQILQGLDCNVIGADFFNITDLDVSHVDMIVMNPPFHNAMKHIEHAWNIAPEGCEIISLCNYNSVTNTYSRTRQIINKAIEMYGYSKNLGPVFTSGADRNTDVEIGLLKLNKPVLNDETKFEGFYYDQEAEHQENGIVQYSEIRAAVQSYVSAISCFDDAVSISDKINSYTKVVNYTGGISMNFMNDKQARFTKTDFAIDLQKQCWKFIFNKINIEKYVTSGVLKDIHAFVEQNQKIPFTVKNVYRMLEIIMGTREQLMYRSIVEAIDKFTRHTHENRYAVEGWKTNSGHMLNKKFIINYSCEIGFNGSMRLKAWQSGFENVIDLTKALCFLNAQDFGQLETVYQLNERIKYTNTWYEWGFFEFKMFKKGTVHLKFKDIKAWEKLNRAYAKAKGQNLPENL